MQRLWTLVPGHLSSHSALSSYGLFVPLTLWRLSVFLRPLVQTLGSCPASGAPRSFAMPPSLGRGRVINNNNNKQASKVHQSKLTKKSRFSTVCNFLRPMTLLLTGTGWYQILLVKCSTYNMISHYLLKVSLNHVTLSIFEQGISSRFRKY